MTATTYERAALVERLRDAWASQLCEEASDLIEADGRRLALADAAPHAFGCGENRSWSTQYCTCWKRDYDATKEAVS